MNDTPHDDPQDVPLPDVPGYLEWSKQKLHAGESEALIAHLDATCMWLRPSELKTVTQEEFEEMLDELKSHLEHTEDP